MNGEIIQNSDPSQAGVHSRVFVTELAARYSGIVELTACSCFSQYEIYPGLSVKRLGNTICLILVNSRKPFALPLQKKEI